MKIEQKLNNTLVASRKLNMLEDDTVKSVLTELAKQTRANIEYILQENK